MPLSALVVEPSLGRGRPELLDLLTVLGYVSLAGDGDPRVVRVVERKVDVRVLLLVREREGSVQSAHYVESRDEL